MSTVNDAFFVFTIPLNLQALIYLPNYLYLAQSAVHTKQVCGSYPGPFFHWLAGH